MANSKEANEIIFYDFKDLLDEEKLQECMLMVNSNSFFIKHNISAKIVERWKDGIAYHSLVVTDKNFKRIENILKKFSSNAKDQYLTRLKNAKDAGNLEEFLAANVDASNGEFVSMKNRDGKVAYAPGTGGWRAFKKIIETKGTSGLMVGNFSDGRTISEMTPDDIRNNVDFISSDDWGKKFSDMSKTKQNALGDLRTFKYSLCWPLLLGLLTFSVISAKITDQKWSESHLELIFHRMMHRNYKHIGGILHQILKKTCHPKLWTQLMLRYKRHCMTLTYIADSIDGFEQFRFALKGGQTNVTFRIQKRILQSKWDALVMTHDMTPEDFRLAMIYVATKLVAGGIGQSEQTIEDKFLTSVRGHPTANLLTLPFQDLEVELAKQKRQEKDAETPEFLIAEHVKKFCGISTIILEDTTVGQKAMQACRDNVFALQDEKETPGGKSADSMDSCMFCLSGNVSKNMQKKANTHKFEECPFICVLYKKSAADVAAHLKASTHANTSKICALLGKTSDKKKPDEKTDKKRGEKYVTGCANEKCGSPDPHKTCASACGHCLLNGKSMAESTACQGQSTGCKKWGASKKKICEALKAGKISLKQIEADKWFTKCKGLQYLIKEAKNAGTISAIMNSKPEPLVNSDGGNDGDGIVYDCEGSVSE
jgi:hypothetical protein